MNAIWLDRPEEETRKVFKLRNGARVIFESSPPHGLWSVKWSKGPTPEALSGKYLTFRSAYHATEVYLRHRDHKTELLPVDEAL